MIRLADHGDVAEVSSIGASHRATSHSAADSGFLVNRWNDEQLHKFVEHGCLHVDVTIQVNAFAIAFTAKMRPELFSTWTRHTRFRDSAPDLANAALLDQIAVRAHCQRRGIGTALFSRVRRHLAGGAVFSEVLAQPRENTCSLQFHGSLGFVPCGFRQEGRESWTILVLP